MVGEAGDGSGPREGQQRERLPIGGWDVTLENKTRDVGRAQAFHAGTTEP
jgi:hypothetical protein